MNATRVYRHIEAPRKKVYRALIDRRAVAIWMAPTGMTSHVHEFDARQGGTFRISLTYDATSGAGKTSANTDTYHGRFVKLVENKQIVESIEFETTNSAFIGEMKVTMTLMDRGHGTDIIAVHENLPPGLSPIDNEIGWQISLAKLASLVEMN